MEVLESLAPVPSEEVVAVKPHGEGIERFRRRVEPASGVFSLPNLSLPQENNSIFSQRQFSDSGAPPSGEGEWDSGHASSSKTKKNLIVGEGTSGSGEASENVETENGKTAEQDQPVVLRPAEPASASTSGSGEESSGVPSAVSAASTQSFSSLSQPPPIAISQNSVNKETSAAASTASFNAAEPEVAEKALNQASNESKEIVATKAIQQQSSTSQAVPAASGSGELHPVLSADTNQKHAGSGSEASGGGLNADELAFIAGLQKAKKVQSTKGKTQKKARLPGSVGNDEDDESDDDNDSESGDVSGGQSDSSASGSEEDEETSSSAESQDNESHRRSEVKQSSEDEASGEEEDYDDESGSGSADDEDNSGESSADEVQRKDTIIDVASGSGVSFISGVSQSDTDEPSSESSGEDDEPEDNMPGSVGQVNDIEKLEQRLATPANATGFAFSSGSGAPVPGNIKLSIVSGSGQSEETKAQDSVVQPVKDQTKTKQSTGSGEEDLPGSVGGIADIGQLESEAHVKEDASENLASSGSGESPILSTSSSQITPEESLLKQLLPDVSSGSGVSEKEEESLPGSIGGDINLGESESGSGEEGVQIVKPTLNDQHKQSGSKESTKTRANVPLASIAQTSDSSGSGSNGQLSGSGVVEDFQSLEIPSSEDETLPGSVGAVGPNLMTMASPENKAGSGMADQSGAGSGTGSGTQEHENLMESFQFADNSGSGSGQVEKSENIAKDTIARMKVSKPVGAFDNEKETTEKANETTIIAQTKPTNDKVAETSGGFGFGLESLEPSSGSGLADELLPGGFGNGDNNDLQTLAGSGGEDASGFSFQSGIGSNLMDTGLSASGSANADDTSELGISNSGSGTLSESNELETVSKKDYAPTALASASASAEQDSGSSSGSGSHALPVVKHTYLPTPKRVGTGISSTTLAASATGSSSSGQSDSVASALPGSVGFEESFSSSGSAVFDASTSLAEGSGSGFVSNIAEFPEEDVPNTEDSSASGAEMVNVVESGAGEGALPSDEDGIEETAERSHTGKPKTFSFNLHSGLQADAMPDTFARIPVNLGIGSSRNYGLGSGTGIDYGSASDFLSGSGGSGTLELTPATSPSDTIVDLFGNAISNAEKESDSESSSVVSVSGEGSSATQHKKGKSRHRIPISGDFSDENSPSEESEEEEQVKFRRSIFMSYVTFKST